jgi:hypothetical protein
MKINWKKAKQTQLDFYNLKISSKTNILGTILALLGSVLIILPLALILIQTIFIYGYHRSILFICLFFIWVGIMLFNGILNYLTIRFSKSLERNNPGLQALEEKHVFYYQCLNPIIAVISLILIIFFAYQIGGF